MTIGFFGLVLLKRLKSKRKFFWFRTIKYCIYVFILLRKCVTKIELVSFYEKQRFF
jgi:hypothetical protein